MQEKSIWLAILVAGASAIGWGICIAIGFWLAKKFICDPADRRLDERKGKKIANELIEKCNF